MTAISHRNNPTTGGTIPGMSLCRVVARGSRHFRGAFTLVELMLVMTLLTVVISVAAPTLSRFFHGRVIDSEARRLLSLTRAGQSRAVSEGVPMVLWVDEKNNEYGLESESSYDDVDVKAKQFSVDSKLGMETVNPILGARNAATSIPVSNTGLAAKSRKRNMPFIRFQPDGSVSLDSLRAVRLIGRDEESLFVAQSRNRLNYEIRNQLNEMQYGEP